MRVAAAFCLLAVMLPAANSVSISDAASKAAEASLSKTETQASVSATRQSKTNAAAPDLDDERLIKSSPEINLGPELANGQPRWHVVSSSQADADRSSEILKKSKIVNGRSYIEYSSTSYPGASHVEKDYVPPSVPEGFFKQQKYAAWLRQHTLEAVRQLKAQQDRHMELCALCDAGVNFIEQAASVEIDIKERVENVVRMTEPLRFTCELLTSSFPTQLREVNCKDIQDRVTAKIQAAVKAKTPCNTSGIPEGCSQTHVHVTLGGCGFLGAPAAQACPSSGGKKRFMDAKEAQLADRVRHFQLELHNLHSNLQPIVDTTDYTGKKPVVISPDTVAAPGENDRDTLLASLQSENKALQQQLAAINEAKPKKSKKAKKSKKLVASLPPPLPPSPSGKVPALEALVKGLERENKEIKSDLHKVRKKQKPKKKDKTMHDLWGKYLADGSKEGKDAALDAAAAGMSTGAEGRNLTLTKAPQRVSGGSRFMEARATDLAASGPKPSKILPAKKYIEYSGPSYPGPHQAHAFRGHPSSLKLTDLM